MTSIPFTVEEDGGPWACDRPKKPGGAFVCGIGPGGTFTDLLHEGGTTAIDFHIRIDRQVPGARGTIRTFSLFDCCSRRSWSSWACTRIDGAWRRG